MKRNGLIALRAAVCVAASAALAVPRAGGIELEMVVVGDPGNPADTNGMGTVDEPFLIGRFEVTNLEYVAFLNAVVQDDPNGLYDDVMTSSLRGGVLRAGVPGNYFYSVKLNFENKPANSFSWRDGARFCNWMHNGQPVGPQGADTTEDGVYDVSLPLEDIARKPGALWFIPDETEWYKAAYYDPLDPGADASNTPDYWRYPTRSDATPAFALTNETGDVINPGPNIALYGRNADWNGTCVFPNLGTCGNLATVGSAGSFSPWGAFDMGGNIYEWTETPGNTIPANPPAIPEPLPTRLIRGGDFANSVALFVNSLGPALNMEVDAANIGLRVAAPLVSCDTDLDCDGDFDLDDVSIFVGVVLGSETDPVRVFASDLNGDGSANGLDIAPFVAAFIAGG